MKKATSAIGILLIATLTLVPVRGGLIAIMRGEPESSATKQHVAFVGSGTVTRVDGKAERLCGVDCWMPISAGAHLKIGDMIRTGKGAVFLKMDESQSFVKVTPDTILHLLPLEKEWDRAVLTGSEERDGFVVRSCRGSAFFQDGIGEWKPVLVNTILPDSAVLRTETGTVLDLYCRSARKPIRLQGENEFKLASLTAPQAPKAIFAGISR